MAKPHPPAIFKWRHFAPEVILCAVRWYLRYSLSYREVEELLVERGLEVDHTTVWRWVQHYAPELEERTRPYLKTDEQILAGGRDLRANQGPLVLPLSSHRFGGSDDRFLSVGVSFCRCGQGIVGQGAGRPFSPSAEGDQHGQGQVLSSSAS